jgi:hypothetical protein
MNDNGAGALMLGGGMVLFSLLIGLLIFVLWIWAIVDAIRNPALSDTQRLIWILVIFFFPILGAIIYAVAGRGGSSGLPSKPVT